MNMVMLMAMIMMMVMIMVMVMVMVMVRYDLAQYTLRCYNIMWYDMAGI